MIYSKIFTMQLVLFTIGSNIFMVSPLHAIKLPWSKILSTYQHIIQKKTYDHIYKQYVNYSKGNAPKIAADTIKNISIKESNEPLIDLIELNCTRITMLPNPILPYTNIAQCNAGTAASSKIRKNVFERLEKMVDTLDELAPSFGYKKGELEIKVFEGLRSLTSQTLLFNFKLASLMLTKWIGYSEAARQAATFVSPVQNNIPVHCTGAAVDIRLWNTFLQKFVDMGPFGAQENQNMLPTFSECISDEQKKNRLFLITAATAAGLANYPYEWWHFSYGDRYWSYCFEKNKQNAIYGLVN